MMFIKRRINADVTSWRCINAMCPLGCAFRWGLAWMRRLIWVIGYKTTGSALIRYRTTGSALTGHMKGIGFKLTRVKLIVYKTRTSPNRTIRNNEEISLNETQVKMIMFHRNSTADNRIIKHIEEINEDRTCIRRRTTDGKIFIHQRNPAYCGSSEAKKTGLLVH